jgi:hypothetical protein
MSNLLIEAHSLIPYESAVYFKWLKSEKNSNLLMKNEFAQGKKTKVKINAVKSGLVRELGLDYKKNHRMLYSVPKVSGLSRVNSGDQLEFEGKRWKVETQTGWFATAGWDSFVMVEIIR